MIRPYDGAGMAYSSISGVFPSGIDRSYTSDSSEDTPQEAGVYDRRSSLLAVESS